MNNASQNHATHPELIGLDLWKQLKRVTVPAFTGDKKTCQNWKAAFTACVDNSPATPVQTITVEAVFGRKSTKNHRQCLGHLATGYHNAKERLERKFEDSGIKYL